MERVASAHSPIDVHVVLRPPYRHISFTRGASPGLSESVERVVQSMIVANRFGNSLFVVADLNGPEL